MAGTFSGTIPNQLMVKAPHITVAPASTRRRRMVSGTGFLATIDFKARVREAMNIREP
ncbi:hypothetical protein MASR2M48_26890 [Spirochaetota bacterium]